MKGKSRSLLTIVVALSILLAVSLGCKQLAKLRETKTAEGNQNTFPEIPRPEKETKPDGIESGLSEKTQLYITKCFNPYANRVMDSYQRYTSWLKDENTGPTGKESLVYGLYDVNGDGEDCTSAVIKANEMEPDLPETERFAEQFSAALKEAVQQIRSVYKYYDQEDYKDDKFQKGKEAHASLIQAFKKFAEVNKEFAGELDDLEGKVSESQLEELRGDPARKFEYSVVDFNIRAKKVSSYVQRTSYGEMKADDLQAMNDELEKSINTMKDEGKSNTFGSMYFSAADDLLKASKELMRRIRDKKPFNSFEARQVGTSGGWMVEGSPDKVIYAYNSLISRRSMLRF